MLWERAVHAPYIVEGKGQQIFAQIVKLTLNLYRLEAASSFRKGQLYILFQDEYLSVHLMDSQARHEE